MATKKDLMNIVRSSAEIQMPVLKDVLKRSPDEQMQFATEARQFSTFAQAMIGQVLKNLKAKADHGEWGSLLDRHGWKQRTAQDYMRFADFAEMVADKNPQALPLLDMTRWTAVRRELDDKALIEFVGGKEVCGLTLEDAQDKNARELKLAFEEFKQSSDSTITKLRKDNADLSVELDTQRQRNRSLQERIGKPFKNSDTPEYLAVQRHESHNLAETVLLSLDELDRMVAELEESPAAISSGGKHLSIAVNSLFTHVNALSARAYGIVIRLEESFSDVIESQLIPDVLYSEEEAKAVMEDRQVMVGEHRQQQAIREAQREAEKPRGRGRPKKAGK